jgi:uncharacterized protein (UPF0332 family)
MKNTLAGKSELVQNWMDRAHEGLNDTRLLLQISREYGGVTNRAYYSMLYAVFALLVPYRVEKGVDQDENIIALFDDKFVRSNTISTQMSKKLHHAFDVCQAYDFQDFFEINREQAIEILNSASEFVNSIEEQLSK